MTSYDWRQTINVAIALAALSTAAGVMLAVWFNRFDAVLTGLVVKNFAAIIGLPFAFLASFVVITLFRQSDAPIAFTGLGIKFEGPAGEVVLWILCYLAISGSIGLLWRR